MSRHAARLATGTEVTSGEVINHNAAWISERLIELGLDPDLHISVPDDRTKMRKRLLYMEKNHDLLVWCLVGIPESEAADLTEPIVKGTGLKVGYRATPPLVRVKLWAPRDQNCRDVLDRLDQALSPWLAGK